MGYKCLLIASVVALFGCNSQVASQDIITEYEAMRKKTGQAHSHVEYCENDIVKLTISSRGELAKRDIYVPRKSVVHFRNRDTLNMYPLGARLAADCLLKGAGKDCREDSKVWGINVALLDSAERHVQNSIDYFQMEPTNQMIEGLYVTRVREDAQTDSNHKKDNILYTNFSPVHRSGEGKLPTLYINYDSNKFWKPGKKRCTWSLHTDEAIRTSRASHCDDLSEWNTYLSEFDALSDQISKEGEFAKECSLDSSL